MNQNNPQITAQKIRARYTEKESNELDALRALDAKVKRPASVFSYVFGSIGAIIMGCGMSLIMTDIAQTVGLGVDPMVTGILVGTVGLAMALVNYPMHKGILNSRKRKYGEEILKLSEKIMNP